MTVNTTNISTQTIADGIEVTFTYDFQTIEPNWILAQTQTPGFSAVDRSDITVTVNEDQENNPGGTVTFDTAPAANDLVNMYRKTPLKQDVDYTAYDAFPAESTENALDRLTFIAQEEGSNSGIPTGTVKVENATDPSKFWQLAADDFGPSDSNVLFFASNVPDSSIFFTTESETSVSYTMAMGPDGKLTLPANIEMGGNAIANMADPVDPQDAATKAYVDAGGGGGGTDNPIFTGVVTIVNSDDPAENWTLRAEDLLGGNTMFLAPDAFNSGLGIQTVSAAGVVNTYTYDVNGQLTLPGNLLMAGFRILNLGTPVSLTDGANKSYVDTQTATKASTNAPTFTGGITLQNATSPSKSFSIAVDDLTGVNDIFIDSASPNSGMVFTTRTTGGVANNYSFGPDGAFRLPGQIDMNNFKIIDLGAPTVNTDAATKLYVDTAVSDMRLKYDIEPVVEADAIHGIEVVSFRYDTGLPNKPQFRDGIHYGVIAQQAEKALPEAVFPAPHDTDEDGQSISGQNLLAFDYEMLVPLLLVEVQKLRKELDELKR